LFYFVFQLNPQHTSELGSLTLNRVVLFCFSTKHSTHTPVQTGKSAIPELEFGLWTLEMLIRGNVIIRKAPKAIHGDECRPRRRSWPRFPLLAPIRDPSLVFRTEDVWLRCNQFIETSEFLIRVSPSHSYNAGRAGLGWMSYWF
jgi:hypothetical protein